MIFVWNLFLHTIRYPSIMANELLLINRRQQQITIFTYFSLFRDIYTKKNVIFSYSTYTHIYTDCALVNRIKKLLYDVGTR